MAFKEWLDGESCMDVARLLKPPYQLKWKSAPIAEWIGDKSVSNLFKKLFALHANGVMSSQKTKAAITKQQSAGGRLNFTKKHDSDFVDNIDFLIRVACSMYREVKQDSTKYARCVRKASMEEKENIDSVLSCLSLGCHADEACAEDEEDVTERPASSKPALANPDSVFKKVLQKTPSAPESPEAKSSQLVTRASGSNEASGSRPALRRQLAFLDLDKKEEEEMLKWMQTEVCVTKRKRMKRPSAKKSDKKKKSPKKAAKEEKEEKKNKVKDTKKAKEKKDKKKQQSFVNKVLKSSFRKRKCDAAYHSAKKKALNDGATLEEACKVASAASAKVGERIAKGELAEE
jgi:hypothetical protein